MPDRSIAYVLKGYPRISELFIASEIWRLEQTGLHIRLHVLKRPDEEQHHPVVDRIAAQPMYLPATTPLSNETLRRWLRHNLAGFVPSLGRVARRHPVHLTRAVCTAGAQSIRAHKGWRPRKIYAKELLQAVALADEVIAAGDVGQLHAHFAHGTTTVTWLASIVTGLPFSFTAHAKDIYLQSLNPAGLLARKMRQAQFVVTCTGANHAHLDGVESDASLQLVLVLIKGCIGQHRLDDALRADPRNTPRVADSDVQADVSAGVGREHAGDDQSCDPEQCETQDQSCHRDRSSLANPPHDGTRTTVGADRDADMCTFWLPGPQCESVHWS